MIAQTIGTSTGCSPGSSSQLERSRLGPGRLLCTEGSGNNARRRETPLGSDAADDENPVAHTKVLKRCRYAIAFDACRRGKEDAHKFSVVRTHVYRE